MRKFLSRLFLGSDDNVTVGSEKTGPIDSSSQWEWHRADEQPYDHYTDAMDDVKQLKREKRHDEVEDLLLWCIDYAEAEAEAQGWSDLPRGYYRHLGIVYRKEGRNADEVEILERYVENTIAPHQEILDRLERARELAD